jgi:signal transduction histidine kinase
MKFEDKEFEKNFQIEHAKKASKNFQFSIFLGFLTIILYAFVDLWSLPITYEFAHKLRFFITGPALLGLVAFSFTKSFYKYIDLSIILAGFITALSIALMIAHAKHNETGYDQYYAGMLLVNVWVATYVRSKFMPALITVVLNNITYIFVALFVQDYMSSSDPTRIHVFYSNLCFILSTNVVSLLGCRDMEIYARNEFLQNAMIQADQVRLVDASRLAAVGEMAAGIAHEINNPLSIILTGTQSLEKKIKLNSLTK